MNEHKIKAEIKLKLNAGIYKLAKKCIYGELWKNMAVITKADDGSIVNGYCCCMHCSEILKCVKQQNGNLYRHKRSCSNKRPSTADNDDVVAEIINTGNQVASGEQDKHEFHGGIAEEHIVNITNDEAEVGEHETCPETLNTNEETGHDSKDLEDGTITAYEDELLQVDKRRLSISDVWQTFALVLTDGGETELSCRHCKMLLKYDYESKLWANEHKCLSAADKRNCLKVAMPSQRIIEEKIKSEISNKIKTGIFQLTKSQRKLSLAWKVFDLITAKNGTPVEDYTCCSICGKVLKCQFMKSGQLHSHHCYIQFKRLWKLETEANNTFESAEAMKNVEKGIKDKIRDESKTTTNPIWRKFSLISIADGSLIKEMVCCRVCKVVLKYNGESNNEDNLQQHKCLQAEKNSKNRKYATHSVESELKMEKSKRKFEISVKLSTGVYKVSMNQNARSSIWKIFARIIETNGALVTDYLFCTVCKEIFAYDGRRTSNLKRHPCMIKPQNSKTAVQQEKREQANKRLSSSVSGKEKEFRIKKRKSNEKQDDTSFTKSHESNSTSRIIPNEIRVSNEAEDISNIDEELSSYENDSIWLRFEPISMDDGLTLKEVVGCRQCKSVFNYNGITKVQLDEHKCFSMDISTTTGGNENDPRAIIEKAKSTTMKEEIDEEYSICVKEEYNYNNSPKYINDREIKYGPQIIIEKPKSTTVKEEMDDYSICVKEEYNSLTYINDREFKDDIKPMREEAVSTIVKEELNDGYLICAKDEYNYSPKYIENNLRQNSLNEPSLTTTVKYEKDSYIIKEFINTNSNEAIAIKKKLNEFDDDGYSDLCEKGI